MLSGSNPQLTTRGLYMEVKFYATMLFCLRMFQQDN